VTDPDRATVEAAILRLARDRALLTAFQADPTGIGSQLGLDASWSRSIAAADRDRLRSFGMNDGITILVSRWFKGDLGDSASSGAFTLSDTPPPAPDVPEELVFAGGCSHVPDLLARPEIDPPEAIKRLSAGYKQLGKVLAATEPDLLLTTADCHFQSFETGAFVVGTAAAHKGSMEFFGRPDLDLQLAGAPEFAESIVMAVRAAGLEVEAAPEVQLDHGLIIPLRHVLPRPDLPVVPIITQPARTFSPWNARAFGRVLRTVLAGSGRRVAFLATGGLSHWLDPGHFGHVDVEFDSHILHALQEGKGLELANLEPFALLSHGQYEFLNWLIMLALAGPGIRGEVFAYEPLKASGGGWTVVNMVLPDRGR
jgi:aromatic ring-opening dioxygenase catalytic subunit (LigB family)